MKQLSIKIILLAAVLLPMMSFSQNKNEKKNQIRIKVEKNIDGKTQVFEKKIDASNLSETQREAMVKKFQDSLMTDSKGKSQGMKIEIEDDDVANIENLGDGDNNIVIRRHNKTTPNRSYFKYKNKDGNGEWKSPDLGNFDFKMEDFDKQMKKFGDEFPKNFGNHTMFFDGNSGKSSSIKALSVYPNNPKMEVLNVNFNAPTKGDVSIKVMDVKGNVVGKEEIKDFQGEYVGQINIGKAAKGTYFVMVTQGEDGSVKRVVVL